MGKTKMTTMLTLMLFANGVRASNMQANKEGMIRRESSTSSLSIMSAEDVREAGVLEVDSAGGKQYTVAGETTQGTSNVQDSSRQSPCFENQVYDCGVTIWNQGGDLPENRWSTLVGCQGSCPTGEGYDLFTWFPNRGNCKCCKSGVSSARDVSWSAFSGPLNCEATKCAVNQKVVGNACVACPAGQTSSGNHDVSGADTTCEAFIPGVVFSVRASTSSNTSLEDPVSGIILTPKDVVPYEGHDCWNLDGDYLQYEGGSPQPVHGQYYTHAAWVFWRATDETWRTIFRGDRDHSIVVMDGAKEFAVSGIRLGMYSNRLDNRDKAHVNRFRDSGYDISSDMSGWQLVIVTGAGDTASSFTGTSTFFTAAEGDDAVQQRGTADHVVSGTKFWRVGYPHQGPGKIAAVHQFNRILTETEMNQLLAKGVGAEPTIEAI